MKAKIIIVLVLLVLLVMLLLQNQEVVTYRIYFWTVSLSQGILVPAVALAGLVLGFILGTLGRRRGSMRVPPAPGSGRESGGTAP
jgi:uncharacterized integral membrane protein